MASKRLLSLTFSSDKPRRRVSPDANAAATAKIGYSSIIEGAFSAPTVIPCSREDLTRMSATGSPAASCKFS